MTDSFGRKINYLRLSITDRCNLRCKYCMPKDGIEKLNHEDILSIESIDEIVGAFAELGINKIRITGGEPLVRGGIISLIEKIKSHPEIKDLAMTTNGIYLEEMAESLKNAGLSRVNISLDSLNPLKYTNMTRGGDLQKVLRGIEKAKEVGLLPIKINVVLIGGFNDDEILDFVKLTQNDDIDVRFIELMPIGEVARWSLSNFISNDIVLKTASKLLPIQGTDPASPAKYYKLPNAKGKVGLISPISCKFCSACNRVRLTSEGKLKYCLHSNEEFDLSAVLKRGESLTDFIQNSIIKKPLEHAIEDGAYITRNMVQVGG